MSGSPTPAVLRALSGSVGALYGIVQRGRALNPTGGGVVLASGAINSGNRGAVHYH